MSVHTSGDGADAATGRNFQPQVQAGEEQMRSRRQQLHQEAMRALMALVTVEGGVVTPDEINILHQIVAGVEDAGVGWGVHDGGMTRPDTEDPLHRAGHVTRNVIGRLVRVNPYVALTGAQEAVDAVQEEEFAAQDIRREALDRLTRAVHNAPGSRRVRRAAEAYERSGQRAEIATECLMLVVATIAALQ